LSDALRCISSRMSILNLRAYSADSLSDKLSEALGALAPEGAGTEPPRAGLLARRIVTRLITPVASMGSLTVPWSVCPMRLEVGSSMKQASVSSADNDDDLTTPRSL